MRNAILGLALAAVAALGGCASPGFAADFKWTAECPASVDKGSEFYLKVVATKTVEPGAEGDPTTKAIEGVHFTYQILWTGGSTAPLRHRGETGEPVKIRARLAPGPATILITSLSADGLDVKVLETKIEVK